jgi:hypothetical protein
MIGHDLARTIPFVDRRLLIGGKTWRWRGAFRPPLHAHRPIEGLANLRYILPIYRIRHADNKAWPADLICRGKHDLPPWAGIDGLSNDEALGEQTNLHIIASNSRASSPATRSSIPDPLPSDVLLTSLRNFKR